MSLVMTKDLKIFREMRTDDLTASIAEFINDYLPYTVRDLSVQREKAWEELKQQSYISNAIVGTGKFTPIHICDLQKLLEVAIDRRDFPFTKRLEDFIAKGFKYAHLDGGNRCDCFIAFFDNFIKCSEGDYRFLEQYENGEVIEEKYNEFVKTPMTFEELEKTHPKIIEKLKNQLLIIFVYKDLTSEERAQVFKMLNDGVNLNAAEKRNPSQEPICTSIREELNTNYKSLMIESDMITEEKAKRFGACELIAKFATLYADKADVPVVGGKTELDNAYLYNSVVGNEFPKFKSFFANEFVPYLKIIVKNKYKFFNNNFFFDFFLILKNMKENGMKLPVINNDSRTTLIEKVSELAILKLDETIQYEQKKGTKSTYDGLFSKTSSMVTKHRFKIVNDYYIPALIDSKIVVKVDTNRFYNPTQKAKLFVKSNVTSNNVTINPAQVFNGSLYQADHVLPHSKGGVTSEENGKLEDSDFNKAKGVTC